MTRRCAIGLAACAAAACAAAACGEEFAGEGGVVAGGGERAGVVYGRLVHARTGAALAFSPGTLRAGAAAARTNEEGWFAAALPPDGAVALSAEVEGFAPAFRRVPVREGGSTRAEVALAPWDVQSALRAFAGGTLRSPGGVSIAVPEGLLGELPPEGEADVNLSFRLAAPDPAGGAIAALPDLRVETGGVPAVLAPIGALRVEAEGPGGEPIPLAGTIGGKPASVTASFPARPDLPGPVRMWRYDEASGAWIAAGDAACDGAACAGPIDRPGWYAAALAVAPACLSACARTSREQPAPGVTVQAEGVDLPGRSVAVTGGDGCACLEVRPGATLRLAAVGASGAGEPVQVGVPLAGGACGGACETVTSGLPAEAVRMQFVLEWDERPEDLDAHLTGPCEPDDDACLDGRWHLSHAAPRNAYARLDTQDNRGHGPEIATVTHARPGHYRFAVRNFSGAPALAASGARVVVVAGGALYTRRSPPEGEGDIWLAADAIIDGTGAVSEVRFPDRIEEGGDRAVFFNP